MKMQTDTHAIATFAFKHPTGPRLAAAAAASIKGSSFTDGERGSGTEAQPSGKTTEDRALEEATKWGSVERKPGCVIDSSSVKNLDRLLQFQITSNKRGFPLAPQGLFFLLLSENDLSS